MRRRRRFLWMYTSREVYRLLVHDGRWTPRRYQQWLGRTLLEALVQPEGTSGVRRKGKASTRR